MVDLPQSCSTVSAYRHCPRNYHLQQQLGCTKVVGWPSQLLILVLALVVCPMTFSSSSSSKLRRRGRGTKASCSVSPSRSSVANKTSVLERLPENAISLASCLPCCDKEVLAYLMDFGHRNPSDGFLSAGWKPWEKTYSLSSAASSSAKLAVPDKASSSFAFLSSQPSLHCPSLCCDCFSCYCSFWAKWNTSENQAVIDVVLDLFDSHLQQRCMPLDRGRKGNLSCQKRGKELDVRPTIKLYALPKDEKGSSSSVMPLKLPEAGVLDDKATLTTNYTWTKQQHLGKHKINQVIPLNIEVNTGQVEKQETSEDREEGASEAIEVGNAANVSTMGLPRVTAGDANLRGRGFLGRVFPDVLGGLALRLWNLVSLKMRNHDMDFY